MTETETNNQSAPARASVCGEDWQQRFVDLVEAVHNIYYAANWVPDSKDHPIDADEQDRLWSILRDAAGFEPGHAPSKETASLRRLREIDEANRATANQDELVTRLQHLAQRREMEGIYTDADIAMRSAEAITALRAQLDAKEANRKSARAALELCEKNYDALQALYDNEIEANVEAGQTIKLLRSQLERQRQTIMELNYQVKNADEADANALSTALAEKERLAKEAVIAWAVCASVHREFGERKDPFFTTRQNDYLRHEEEARAALDSLTPASKEGK